MCLSTDSNPGQGLHSVSRRNDIALHRNALNSTQSESNNTYNAIRLLRTALYWNVLLWCATIHYALTLSTAVNSIQLGGTLHSICRVTITQIHKPKIELGGTLYSLHLQSDRLGREAAAWNNEPLPSQRTHCKHTFHTAVQESVLFEQRSEHYGDLVPTRPVHQLSMCSPCVLTSKFETPPHHRHNPKLCFIVLLLMTSWKSEEKNIPLLLPWCCWCE